MGKCRNATKEGRGMHKDASPTLLAHGWQLCDAS